MNKLCLDIKDFHEKFQLHYKDGPRQLPPDLQDFRNKFLQEELDEYIEASEEGDLNKAFDALIDLVYVALGTSYLHGFPWDLGWDRVQRANMAKVRALTQEGCTDSGRLPTYDIVKPPGWAAPDHSDLVKPWEPKNG